MSLIEYAYSLMLVTFLLYWAIDKYRDGHSLLPAAIVAIAVMHVARYVVT